MIGNVQPYYLNYCKREDNSIHIPYESNCEFFESTLNKINSKDKYRKISFVFGNKWVSDKERIIDTVKLMAYKKIRNKLGSSELNDAEIATVFDRLTNSSDIKKSSLDTVKYVKKLFKVIDNLEAFGSAPQVYKDDMTFNKGEDAKNLVKFFISDAKLSLNLVSCKLLQGLLIKQNPEMLQAVIDELQNASKKIVDELNEKKITAHEKFLTDTLIGNLLAIYPFMEPREGQIIKVPQQVGERWELVDYEVHKIPLTPEKLGDPLYAYGLMPKNTDLKVPPHLLFMGTPPPTTTGVALAEWVDLAPDYSVGEIAFEYSKNDILKWLDEANNKCKMKAQVYGQSLGGSLSLLTVSAYPEKVGKVYAYNPPAPTSEVLEKYEKLKKDKLLPEVHVYAQQNDLVNLIGNGWHKDWNVHRVTCEVEDPSIYLAHIQSFSGRKNVCVSKIDVEKDATSSSRNRLNKIANIIKKPIFFWKTFKLKISILAKSHTLFSLASKVWKVGVIKFFKMMFSLPSRDVPFIETLLKDIAAFEGNNNPIPLPLHPRLIF